MTEVGATITNQYKSVSTGQFLMDHTDDGHDASTDLFWGVTMIIRAYPQHHHLWADVVQFSIHESPQYMLRSIPTNPKIQSMERRKQFSPNLKLMQKLDKWITNKQNIRLFSFTVWHKSIVLQDENT